MSIIKDAPEEIYLVIEGVEPGDTFKDCHDVTWEAEQINDNDVKYIRADKLAALEADAARMKDALLQIKEMTDAEGDEDTYRLDDPEGCFDMVFAVAEKAIKPDDAMKGGA